MPPPKPRIRKQKKIHQTTAANDDTNVEVLPARKPQKIAHRPLPPGLNGKKKKRLDKYIETKLKREKSLDLLKKLAGARTDTSGLESSKGLGTGRKIKQLWHSKAATEDIDTTDTDTEPDEVVGARELQASLPLGAGLKRPLDVDQDGNPVMGKRQRTNPRSLGYLWDETHEGASSSCESSWDGLSSEIESEFESRTEDELPTSKLFATTSQPHETIISAPRDQMSFKHWATEQINQARDFSTASTPLAASILQQRPPRPPDHDPLPAELLPYTPRQRDVYSVTVDRSAEVQEARLRLPIVAEEQKIMEAIHNNPVVVVCGTTGSGKTTQVPQFLYEAGYGCRRGPTPGMIGITQPRRVAAVTMAKRVGQELGSAAEKVSYQIRYDGTTHANTAIKFMTDGILIREIADDFALTKYSAIIIDEAHERSVNTDLLVGMMSRIVNLRSSMHATDPRVKPLKLIIMSATLMIESFTQSRSLFRDVPPIVESEGRQYPVTMHFARKTHPDYVEEAFQKVSRGHQKLPPGSMLVFLTGQKEIAALAKRLQGDSGRGPGRGSGTGPLVQVSAIEAPLETEDVDLETALQNVHHSDPDHDDHSTEDDFHDADEERPAVESSMMVLPLYSQLTTKEQLRVFEAPPANTRLIVLATNVAETSITIPGIRYVFDCGRSKERRYDSSGVQRFEVGWISKSSAAQRAGRAGRTGPGHCYRLYSSAVYERDFPEHTEPEILRTPAEGIVLQLKSMDLHHIARFPFPTPPDPQALAKAEKLLHYLGAIDHAGRVTNLGKELSTYPLSPRFAKMIALGNQHGCIYLVVAMVAALAVPDILIPEHQLELHDAETNGDDDGTRETRETRKAYGRAHHSLSMLDPTSDACKCLSAFCAYLWARQSGEADQLCQRLFLRAKAMEEAFSLWQQIMRIVASNHPGSLDPLVRVIPRATEMQVKILKQIVAAAFIDQTAIRADLVTDARASRQPQDVPYLPLFPSHEGLDQAVYIHPSSILTHTTEMPEYLIYSRLQQSANRAAPKVRLHALTAVTGQQLAGLARGTPLLEYGKPMGKVQQAELNVRTCWLIPSLVGPRGSIGWPLPSQKVQQRKDERGVWIVEKIL